MARGTEIETKIKIGGGQRKEEKRLAAELERSRLRIAELEASIKERLIKEKKLHARYEKLKSFAFAIIHDLKQPSIVVYIFSQKLRLRYGDIMDERGKIYCAALMKEAEKISTMVNMIMEFIKSGEAPLRFEQLDIKEILKTVREGFSHQLVSRRVRWEEQTVIPMIRGDKLAITRVLENLVDNALKYGGGGLSRIMINCGESRESHIVSVADDGNGLREDDSEKIFTRFYRASGAKSACGTGLGLSIVKKIAERHGGHAWARPGPDGGAIFYVSIAKNL